MASFELKKKPIPEMFLGVDDITPEYDCSLSGNRLSGIWVYIGGTAHYFECDRYTICNPIETAEDGRRQAFDLFKELYDMSPCDRADAFGKVTMLDLVSKNTYEDIVKKLDAWKKSKEICVRDEVANINNGRKFIVTVPPHMSSNSVEYMSGISKDGKVYEDVVAAAYKKTGVHVDDLDAYLGV